MKKYSDIVIQMNDINLPYSQVAINGGVQIEASEWANKLMEDPKLYLEQKNIQLDKSLISDEDKVVMKLVQQMEKSKLVPKNIKELERQVKQQIKLSGMKQNQPLNEQDVTNFNNFTQKVIKKMISEKYVNLELLQNQ